MIRISRGTTTKPFITKLGDKYRDGGSIIMVESVVVLSYREWWKKVEGQ